MERGDRRTASAIGLLFLLAVSLAGQSEKSAAVVLRDLRVIDGTGAPARAHQTVVIADGKIRAVGATNQVTVPDGAEVLDLAAHTVLPGLVMLHEHMIFMVDNQFSHALPFSAPRLYLAFGVTTIRTAGTDHPYVEINVKRAIDRGETPGPEIHLTSPYLNGPGGLLSDIIVTEPEEARRSVRYWAALGFRWFKVHDHITTPVLAAIVDEAHKHQARVTGHLGSVGCAEAAVLGIDNIEHSWFSCRGELQPRGSNDSREARAAALFPKLIAAQVAMTATPVDWVRSLDQRELDTLHPAAREAYVQMRALAGKPGGPPPLRGEGPLSLRFVKAGGRLVLGSDPCCGFSIPGFASHDAVKLLVEAGFTPLEAIRIATLEGARFLGIDDRVGTIAAGKEADLLIVRGDPAGNIHDLSNVTRVFANGKAHDPQALLAEVKGHVGWR